MNKKINKSIEFIKIYSLLFSAAKLGLTNKPINPSRIREKNYITYKKGVGICCIGRKENLYAKEFVEYYIKLGVKKIIIYDDNEINGEKFKDVLNKYVINKKVEIIDIHGFESAQFPSYNDCYMTYGSQFDFLLFLDFDEFVTIENNIDINTYLYNKKFRKCETIILNWVLYGDNNLVKYDNRTMIERFTKPWSYRNLGKCVVRTNISNLMIVSTHIIGINTKYFCDSNGNKIFPRMFFRGQIKKNEKKIQIEKSNKPEAYIKHFYTKSVEEFCNKINKGDGHFHKTHPRRFHIFKNRIIRFFEINSITYEKINIIENCSGLNLDIYKKKIKKEEKKI